MHELERRSGVGRETIRYYIRLGLLPEPVRPKPNVATYAEEHVDRLKAIRRLQSERYLPLAFIKTLLDRPTQGEASMIPGLDLALAEGLGVQRQAAKTNLDEAARETGLSRNEIEILARDGVVFLTADGLSPMDVAVLRSWGQVRGGGFSEETGFFAEDAAIYAQTLAPLAAREVERFLTRISGGLSAVDAANLARTGITRMNEMIGLMRANYLLRRLDEMASSERLRDPPRR